MSKYEYIAAELKNKKQYKVLNRKHQILYCTMPYCLFTLDIFEMYI